MKWYADLPERRTRQLLGDALFVLWIVGCVWLANAVHDATLGLAGPGQQAMDAANGLASHLRGAADALARTPLVGDQVSAPFEGAARASDDLAAAGAAEVRAVRTLANLLGASVALLPVLAVALFYVPLRWRFMRRATAGQRFIDAAPDLDLFALRALALQPMHKLAAISDDPAGAWRQQDPATVRALATLELRSCGLRPPAAG